MWDAQMNWIKYAWGKLGIKRETQNSRWNVKTRASCELVSDELVPESSTQVEGFLIEVKDSITIPIYCFIVLKNRINYSSNQKKIIGQKDIPRLLTVLEGQKTVVDSESQHAKFIALRKRFMPWTEVSMGMVPKPARDQEMIIIYKRNPEIIFLLSKTHQVTRKMKAVMNRKKILEENMLVHVLNKILSFLANFFLAMSFLTKKHSSSSTEVNWICWDHCH